MYPVAWGVTQIEDKEIWHWFMQLLVDDLGMEDGYRWTIISDQQKLYLFVFQVIFTI